MGLRKEWQDHGTCDQYDLANLYQSNRVCTLCYTLYN